MPYDLAVVLDVAGTILKMYRVAKDIPNNIILEKVITWKLIMEKRGRALVVPQIDPEILVNCFPEDPISSILKFNNGFEISCSSAPISKVDAINILFTSKVKLFDIQEVYRAVKARCPNKYQTTGMIIDTDIGDITHTISTGGIPFSGLDDVLRRLECLGAEIYIASGDSMRSLLHLAEYGIHPDRIIPAATPKRKQDAILDLKDKFRFVVMVGDGLNDIYALQAADFGILTIQQDTMPAPELINAADWIIKNIKDLPKLIEARCC
ncbi:MAG: HAD family hydrolase [Methanotrichaceae archaeon]|nr:HAD family hydrolase [Methanotrichaceae archaeon]